MSDSKIELDGGGGWVALAILIVYFWGDPDLHDALIGWLMR